MKFFTGRDWYLSVKYKFIEENINKAIEFKLDNNKYIGIMLNAPDNQNDKHKIVENVILIQDDKLIPLNHVKTMLINCDEINEIKAYKEDFIKKMEMKK